MKHSFSFQFKRNKRRNREGGGGEREGGTVYQMVPGFLLCRLYTSIVFLTLKIKKPGLKIETESPAKFQIKIYRSIFAFLYDFSLSLTCANQMCFNGASDDAQTISLSCCWQRRKHRFGKLASEHQVTGNSITMACEPATRTVPAFPIIACIAAGVELALGTRDLRMLLSVLHQIKIR